MDKQNLMPQAAQPVNRTTTGLLSPELAELSEEALQLEVQSDDSASVLALSHGNTRAGLCSYDGDDAE